MSFRGLGLAVVLVAGGAGAVPLHEGRPQWHEPAPDAAPLRDGPEFSTIARGARGAVVSITSTARESIDASSSPTAREFFERFYGAGEPPSKGMASGFIVRSDGYILTNEHVVEDAAAIAVTLADDEERSYPATVVGRDEPSDLALIKIDAGRPLPALSLGDSEQLGVGDWVCAIGNPFGLSHSLTVGVVSYIGRRDINPSGRAGYYDFIQTDASINPGNSGGPLLDRHGHVVGISAAVNASGQGIGFAIPVNMAKDVLPALYERGFVERSFLGISIQDLSPDLAASFGVRGGVVVTDVTSGGPAAEVGLTAGDVVVRVGGQSVDRAYRLRWIVSGTGVGRRVGLDLMRAGTPVHVEATLAPLPGSSPAFKRAPLPAPRDDLGALGFSVSGPPVAAPHGRGFRVNAVDPLGQAYVAGLREGDLVLKVGNAELQAPDELAQATAGQSVVRLFVQHGLKPAFVAFRPRAR